jgi:hypothetical protein
MELFSSSTSPPDRTIVDVCKEKIQKALATDNVQVTGKEIGTVELETTTYSSSISPSVTTISFVSLSLFLC